MFRWLTGIWDIVADLSLRAKTIFVFCTLFIVGGYFFFDRYLTFQRNMAQPSEVPKGTIITKVDLREQMIKKDFPIIKAKEIK